MIPKIIITGSFGVGKSSIFDRLVHQKFEKRYLTTIGVRTAETQLPAGAGTLAVTLWDIAGEVSQDKVPVSYFMETRGILYIFDLTRPSTYKNIQDDIAYLKEISKSTPIWIIANKCDCLEAEEIEQLQEQLQPDFVTSALKGTQIEALMQRMAADLQS